MPVEIRELHIRVSVTSEPARQSSAAQRAAGEGGAQADRDAIVAECVEQLMTIIQAKKER